MQSLSLPALFSSGAFSPFPPFLPSPYLRLFICPLLLISISPHQNHPHTPPNGVCQCAQSWLGMHSELKINAVALVNASKVICNACVCIHMHSSTWNRQDKAFIDRFLLLSPELEHKHTKNNTMEQSPLSLTLEVKFLVSLLRSFAVAALSTKGNKDRHQACFIPIGRHKHQTLFILQSNGSYGMCNNCGMREREDMSIDSSDGEDTERYSERPLMWRHWWATERSEAE